MIERSVSVDRSADTGVWILNELRQIDSLALTPLMALSLVNEWRNRLLNGDKETFRMSGATEIFFDWRSLFAQMVLGSRDRRNIRDWSPILCEWFG